jgi:iron(II)-dependent oxidoreductase
MEYTYGMNRKDQIRGAMQAARAKTLALLNSIPDDILRVRIHDFYSPVGWHFGHIARTEEHWIVVRALGLPCQDEFLSFILADTPDNPKDNRVNIPDRAGLVEYLNSTRKATLDALEAADLASDNPFLCDGYAWDFAYQHECQHQETILEMLHLIHQHKGIEGVPQPIEWKSDRKTEFVELPGGVFEMGSNEPSGYDNEKRAHSVEVAPFRLAKTPVTAYEWSTFVEDYGYLQKGLWSDAGWQWREQEKATLPEYWVVLDGDFYLFGPQGLRAIHPDEPVAGISWYEAEAYCRWTGKRMPTEEEWEFAASPDGRRYPWGNDEPTPDKADFGANAWQPQSVGAGAPNAFGATNMAGSVWEWTSSKFLPYPGFEAFPYDGYSKDHMDGRHFVCRGGSWVTAAPILRRTFRNWYFPSYRQGFIGLRLAE